MSKRETGTWTPRSWIVPPGLTEKLKRFDIRSEILIEQYKKGDFRPLLIKGATGVGKSFFAEFFIHKFLGMPINLNEYGSVDSSSMTPQNSACRKSALPQVKFVNCAALSEALLESELFGHVKGAFTGASNDKIGWLETVKDGILVLEEVGEMSKTLQAKLLIAVENKKFQKVGSTTDVKLQAQIIATSNVDRSKFRDDFWYRFEIFSVPAICERREDVLYYMELFDPDLMKIMTKGAVFSALCYHWPGNVREIQRVCSAIREEIIYSYKFQQFRTLLTAGQYEAAPKWFRFDYDEKEISGYRFDRAEFFEVELIDAGIDVKSINRVLQYYGLAFDSSSVIHRGDKFTTTTSVDLISYDEFKICFVKNDLYKYLCSGLYVFSKFFSQDVSSNNDLFDLASPKPIEKDSFIFKRDNFKYIFKNKRKLNKIKENELNELYGFCCEYYTSSYSSLGNIPDEYKKAMVESLKFATGIKSITFDDILDIELLYKRNSDNAFLAAYFGEKVDSLFEQIPIEEVALDDLRPLYYETVCSRIGVAHGYKVQLAKIAGKDKSTVTNELKKMNLNEKFEKPNFIPKKRLIVLKE